MLPEDPDERVLVLAPAGRDAALIADVLRRAGVHAESCGDCFDLTRKINAGAGAAVVTEEALYPADIGVLRQSFERQPPWSDFPLLVLVRGGATASAHPIPHELETIGNITRIERPIRVATLLSGVRSALRGRRRQYEIRAYLSERLDTERQLAAHAREAHDANRAKDEFLAMLGHELRTPLGTIINASSVLDRSGGAGDQLRTLPAIISRQSRHLGRLVDDLLDVARVSSGRIVLQRELVDLREIAERGIGALRQRYPDLSEPFDVTLSGESAFVIGDPTRIEQIVSNLLENAVKYSPQGGRIAISVGEEADHAVLRVADSGLGIEPELLPRVFDLFAQGARSLDRSQGGLGLGLTVVRRLVELHGGTIGASSSGAGLGSTFTVRFPTLKEVTTPSSAGAERRAGVSRRVLIVEDNADAREVLRILLERVGHEVVAAADGREAIASAQELRPDIALVDIGLPGIDGYEVARQLQDSPGCRSTHLVAVTGYGQPEDRRRAAAAGFEAHLVKPVDPDALVQLLADLDPVR